MRMIGFACKLSWYLIKTAAMTSELYRFSNDGGCAGVGCDATCGGHVVRAFPPLICISAEKVRRGYLMHV